MKTYKIIAGTRYNFEIFMMRPVDGIYRFGLQIFSSVQAQSFSMRLPEEFIEDEIDNAKRKEYLEKVAVRVIENHLEDVLKLNAHAVVSHLKYWFSEAKRQIDTESNS